MSTKVLPQDVKNTILNYWNSFTELNKHQYWVNRVKPQLDFMMSGDESLYRYSRSTNSSLDPRVYVMKTEGWIVVRNNNIELYGLDSNKLKDLSSGLDDIIDQETGWNGVEDEEIDDEKIEFNLFDHKNNKSMDVTLKDIKDNNLFRPQRIPQTTYSAPLFIPTNKTAQPSKVLDAKSRSQLSTSEGVLRFKEWLIIRNL
jgi:hypothetical protein